MSANQHQPNEGRQWRQMPTEYRRRQLIDAAIDVIAEVGISKTTVNLVSKRAGLSPAVINLQFQSKDNLLRETFNAVRDEFKEAWVASQIADVGTVGVAQKIHNMLAVHFRPELCTPRKLKVWFAFLGEASARDTYLDITHRYETAYVGVLSTLCADLVEEGQYANLNPDNVARSLLAACDGLWLARMLRPDTLTPDDCTGNLSGLLTAFFPKHFAP